MPRTNFVRGLSFLDVDRKFLKKKDVVASKYSNLINIYG